MTINNKTQTEKGHYLIRILVLLSLANLFLYALFSFATAIRLTNSALMKKRNYMALNALMANEIEPNLDAVPLQCSSKNLAENLKFTSCIDKSSNTTLQFMGEKYDAQ